MFYGRLGCERGGVWDTGGCRCGMVACEEKTEVRGAEGLAFLAQAGILLDDTSPKLQETKANKRDLKIDPHSSNCSLCPRATRSPNSKLP